MKNVCTTIMLYLTALILSASCGYMEEGSCVGDCREGQSTDQSTPSPVDKRALDRVMVYSTDDEFIGYAMDYHFDFIKVFIPAYQVYVTMHPNTGEYLEYPLSQHEEIYFDGIDCTGNAIMPNFSGKVGATYIKAKNQLTYLIHSTEYYSTRNPFRSRSRLVANRPASDSCRNSNYVVETYAANLVEEDAMPDLTSYAPFQMFSKE